VERQVTTWAVFIGAFIVIQLGSKRLTGKYLSNYAWDAMQRYPWLKAIVLLVGAGLTSHLVFGWP
jgi:hypothetical protein